MSKYNRQFELDREDLSLIETALRERTARLAESKVKSASVGGADDDIEDTIRAGEELLGRLHNQKVFYRPRKQVYIGG